jgi:cob(I)alamin adenosyltransferase
MNNLFMKIYTKKGDTGTTQLIGGTRVVKHHIRIEAYGTIDELNSYIGLVADLISDKEQQKVLRIVQDKLFVAGSILAADPQTSKMKLPELAEDDILLLEQMIDKMDTQLPTMTHFILPGGHPTISHCHIARCICRRAERTATNLNEISNINILIIKYLNRLSDYLFTLARWEAKLTNTEEIKWISNT